MGKRGRKLESGIIEVRSVEVNLDDLSITMLKVVGRGNLSRGIRHASRVAFKAYQQEPDEPSTNGAPEAPTSTTGSAP